MKEKFTISDTFPSSILSPACGVEVTITITGSVMVLTFPHRPVGPTDLQIANIDWVATADNNQVRFRNVGIELVRVEPDGTVSVTIAGHHPVEFTGVMKINLDTGEVIQEPEHSADIKRLCELLTA
jgi:hypothetical protein